VTIVEIPTLRTVYIIHSPEFYETAREIERVYEMKKYVVRRYNTGVTEEAEKAEHILRYACEEGIEYWR
jgi:hypothetical protein